MGRSTEEEMGLSEQRTRRSWTAQQKLEIVLAGLRGDRSVRDVCRERQIAETLFYTWREKLLEVQDCSAVPVEGARREPVH
jgi:transposase-like protein